MRQHSRIFPFLAIAVLSFIIASCTPTGTAPVINSFTADETTITAGSAATLSWSITGATSAEITPGVGSVAITAGSQTVTPAETTTYVLHASNTHGSVAREATVTVIPLAGPVVTAVTVSPAQATVTVGDTRAFAAAVGGSGAFDDSVLWTSSDPAVATINEDGLATTLSAGTTTVTATSVQTPGVSGTAELVVTTEPVEPAVTSVTVTPEAATIEVGATQQFAAAVTGDGEFDDTVIWSSSATGVATVDTTTGLVTAVAAGTATITATSVETPAVTGTATVTVTLGPIVPVVTAVTVTTPDSIIEVGETVQLTADVIGEGAFNDSVTWTSNNEAIATVSTSGVVTGVATGLGPVLITATSVQTPTVSGATEIVVAGPVGVACVNPDAIVVFPDFLLRERVHALFEIPEGEPLTCADVQREITPEDSTDGQEINSVLHLSRTESDVKVTTLEGIQHLTSLRRLELAGNELSDISQLSGLASLVELNLDTNQITDLTPLAGLTNLEVLGFFDNQVEDVTPLAGLTSLEILYASYNRIKDVTPLAGLVDLDHLWLMVNCSVIVDFLGSDCLVDIDALATLGGLEVLLIAGNEISDISAVAGLTNLQMLDASVNLIEDIDALGSLASLATVRLADNPIHSLQALAANAAFTGPRDAYSFSRGGVTLPLNDTVTFHNLDLTYNCLLDDPDTTADVAEIESRNLTVFGADIEQNVASRTGCDTYPGAEATSMSVLSRQSGPSLRQQLLQDLLNR